MVDDSDLGFAHPADEVLYYHLSPHKQSGPLPAQVIAKYSGCDISIVRKSMARLYRRTLVQRKQVVLNGRRCWVYWREN